MSKKWRGKNGGRKSRVDSVRNVNSTVGVTTVGAGNVGKTRRKDFISRKGTPKVYLIKRLHPFCVWTPGYNDSRPCGSGPCDSGDTKNELVTYQSRVNQR